VVGNGALGSGTGHDVLEALLWDRLLDEGDTYIIFNYLQSLTPV
jgi:hypothetical protein